MSSPLHTLKSTQLFRTTNNQELNEKINKLKKTIENLRKILKSIRSTISKLRQNIKNIRHLFRCEYKIKPMCFPLKDAQVNMQLKRNKMTKKHWLKEEQDFAFKLYYKSPSAYHF